MTKRIKQLDALRAVALLLVLGCHITWHPLLLRCGWTGVDLFFVLSGFLIAGLLMREYKSHNELHVWRFILRRALKIYPAYYVLLFGTLAYDLVRGRPDPWAQVWPDLIFVQNYRPGIWAHLWSLGAEEQFYFLLPCLLALLIYRRRWAPFKSIPAICIAIMCFCFLCRLASVLCHTSSSWFPGCVRGFDGLALGVMISYFNEFQPHRFDGIRRERFLLLSLSIVCLLPAIAFPSDHPVMRTVGLTFLYLGYAGLLLFFVYCVQGQGRIMSVLAFIGSYSYTIYLFHMPVAHYVVPALRQYLDRNVLFVLYLAISIGMGIFVANIIERPILRARERLMPSLAKVIKPAPLHSPEPRLEDAAIGMT